MLAAPARTGINDLDEFYKRFKKLQDHHVRYPNQITDGFELELSTMVDEIEEQMEDEYEQDDRKSHCYAGSHADSPEAINSLFSGEERYGLCLDLYGSHTHYNNLKTAPKRLQYLQYLDALATIGDAPLHSELPVDCKHSKDYEKCVRMFFPSWLL